LDELLEESDEDDEDFNRDDDIGDFPECLLELPIICEMLGEDLLALLLLLLEECLLDDELLLDECLLLELELDL